MSTLIYTNTRMFMDGYELSGIQNQIGVDYAADMLDDTVFGSSRTRSNKPGLKGVSVKGSGFWDTVLDVTLFNRITASAAIVSAAPEGQAVGDTVFFVKGVNGAYNPISGAVGELLGFEVDFHAASTALVRGKVGALGTKTVTGNGDGVQLGTLSATQVLYAAAHIVGPVTGTTPTIDIVIQSDNASNFPSPTDQITFTQASAIGAQWGTKAGAVTDDWWRVKLTLGGTNPSFPIFVSFGILTIG